MIDKKEPPLEEYGEKYFQAYNYADRPLGRLSMYAFARKFYASLVRKHDLAGGGRLLEMGSGLGHLLSLLQDEYETFGFDIAHYAANTTKRNSPDSEVLTASAEELSIFTSEAFSVVIALHLVEHLSAPASTLKDIYRILKPGGLMIFATPNPSYRMRKYKRPKHLPDAIDKDPTHINVQTPETWIRWAEEAKFEIVRTGGDGLWDVPYLPILPRPLQFALFGFPSLVQVLAKRVMIPIEDGVNLIVIARKPDRSNQR